MNSSSLNVNRPDITTNLKVNRPHIKVMIPAGPQEQPAIGKPVTSTVNSRTRHPAELSSLNIFTSNVTFRSPQKLTPEKPYAANYCLEWTFPSSHVTKMMDRLLASRKELNDITAPKVLKYIQNMQQTFFDGESHAVLIAKLREDSDSRNSEAAWVHGVLQSGNGFCGRGGESAEKFQSKLTVLLLALAGPSRVVNHAPIAPSPRLLQQHPVFAMDTFLTKQQSPTTQIGLPKRKQLDNVSSEFLVDGAPYRIRKYEQGNDQRMTVIPPINQRTEK